MILIPRLPNISDVEKCLTGPESFLLSVATQNAIVKSCLDLDVSIDRSNYERAVVVLQPSLFYAGKDVLHLNFHSVTAPLDLNDSDQSRHRLCGLGGSDAVRCLL
jgi:hypothetical protein